LLQAKCNSKPAAGIFKEAIFIAEFLLRDYTRPCLNKNHSIMLICNILCAGTFLQRFALTKMQKHGVTLIGDDLTISF